MDNSGYGTMNLEILKKQVDAAYAKQEKVDKLLDEIKDMETSLEERRQQLNQAQIELANAAKEITGHLS